MQIDMINDLDYESIHHFPLEKEGGTLISYRIYILYSLTHHFYEFQEKDPSPPLTMRQKIMIHAKFVNNNNVYIEITIHLFA